MSFSIKVSVKPTTPASASHKQPRKHCQSLRHLFSRKEVAAKIFPHDSFPKYDVWGDKDCRTEAIVGTSCCPSCRSHILVTREVQMKDKAKVADNLRFEQAIEGGAGRCVKTMPTSFNDDYIEFKKCRTEKLEGEVRKNQDGTTYELLWEKDYGIVECVKCHKKIEYINHVRRHTGETRVRWFMTYRV